MFWEVSNDTTIRALIRKVMWFSFHTDSSLRVNWSVVVWSWTITTVTTVWTITTWNIWFWDMWKNATAQSMSMNTFYSSIWRNFIR